MISAVEFVPSGACRREPIRFELTPEEQQQVQEAALAEAELSNSNGAASVAEEDDSDEFEDMDDDEEGGEMADDLDGLDQAGLAAAQVGAVSQVMTGTFDVLRRGLMYANSFPFLDPTPRATATTPGRTLPGCHLSCEWTNTVNPHIHSAKQK